jgi:hypothetical protein
VPAEGWVAIGTIALALATCVLAGFTYKLAKASAADARAQWRPVLIPGAMPGTTMHDSVSYDAATSKLQVPIQNVGRGPAIFLQTELDPARGATAGQGPIAALGPGSERLLIFHGVPGTPTSSFSWTTATWRATTTRPRSPSTSTAGSSTRCGSSRVDGSRTTGMRSIHRKVCKTSRRTPGGSGSCGGSSGLTGRSGISRPHLASLDPPHAILALDLAPPAVLGEQPVRDLAGRHPAVNLHGRIHGAYDALSVQLAAGFLRLLRGGWAGHSFAADRVPHHPATMLHGDAVPHTALEHVCDSEVQVSTTPL